MRLMTYIEYKSFISLTKFLTNNWRMIVIVLALCFAFLLIGCAPAAFTPYKPEPITFNETPPYSIQDEINQLPKPSPMVRIYAKQIDEKTFVTVENKEEATHVILAPEEYAKVGAVIKLATTYKQLVLDQEYLINVYIKQINALKELLAMEQKKTEMYRELWIGSENAYRREAYDHKVDNVINKTGLYGVTIGSIVILLLTL